MMTTALAIGATFALAVGLFGTWIGFDRDRSFYPVIMLVIALLYILFAVMGAPASIIAIESAVAALYIAAAVAGFKKSLWIVAAALAGHGVMDWLHPYLYVNPGVPAFWPPFCGAYDVVAGGYLAWRLAGQRGTISGGRAPGRAAQDR